MPRIEYACTKCKRIFKRFFSKASSIVDTTECKFCKEEAERILSAPTTKSTMVIDNGLQGRKTEIIHDIVEMNKERDKKGYNRGD
jgi:putative FmdB family regulatory protein